MMALTVGVKSAWRNNIEIELEGHIVNKTSLQYFFVLKRESTGGLTNYSIDILESLSGALRGSYGMIRTLKIDNTNNKKEL